VPAVTSTVAGDRSLQLVGERLPFAMLPRWLLHHPDVAEGAKFLYCVLNDLVSGRQGPTRPVTRTELAAVCGVSADTIDRRLAQLVAVGAVEKQSRIRAGGQQANVYLVWFTPPEGLHRHALEVVDNRGRKIAAPVEGSANAQVKRSRESAAPPPGGSAGPHRRGGRSRTGAAPNTEAFEEPDKEEEPPRPPEGGQAQVVPPMGSGRRSEGTNPRALADRAEAERLKLEAIQRQANLDAQTEARRQADLIATLAAEQLEAEARALSAVLDDPTLAAVIRQVTGPMSGLLAGSAVAVTMAVIGWCRTAQAHHAGAIDAAIVAGLASDLGAGEGNLPLTLPAAPSDTPVLRSRIAAQLKNREVT
jgi:hypothetical protein